MSKDGILDKGAILVEDGKIVSVGKDTKNVSDDVEIIDLSGKILFPGMIDAHSHVGSYSEAMEPPLGYEVNEVVSPATPYVRVIDGVNPLDRGFKTITKAGITTIFCTPGSSNVISGTAAVLKTVGRTINDMILLEPAAMKMAFGRKMRHPSKDVPYPATRMGTAAIARKYFVKAINYLTKKDIAQKDPRKEPPEPDIGLEYLCMALRNEIPVHVHMSRSDDIMTFARIAEEFNLRWCIAHGFQAHLVADELSKRNVGVILGPYIMPNRDIHWTPEAPAILHKAGVKVALQSDGPRVFPAHYLTFIAAAAAKAGLDEWEALKSITINAAEIIGVDNRVGSIEVGKDADIVVFSGHPFKMRTKVERVFIDGKEVYNID